MLPAQHAIHRLRRDLTLASVLRVGLFMAALACVFIETIPGFSGISGSLALAGVGIVFFILSYRSLRGSQLSAASPALIAAGQLEQAEQHIEEALQSFSLFRGAKLRSLHHLLLLRHAQRRYAEAATLARELLGQRLGRLETLSRSARLILADSLLETGDAAGAYHAIAGLYSERLSLGEALELTLIQLDYEARIHAWSSMMQSIDQKASLLEILPAEKSARGQALLALAAKRAGRPDWENHLRRRAELLTDVDQLTTRRPMLQELWITA